MAISATFITYQSYDFDKSFHLSTLIYNYLFNPAMFCKSFKTYVSVNATPISCEQIVSNITYAHGCYYNN